MASLACQRPSGASIGSGFARIRHEPFDAGSNAPATILKQQECPSPRLWSCYAVNDRNGALVGNVSGSAGVEGRRFTSSAHEGGASMCVFQETAQPLQRSAGALRNHLTASVAQQPEAINTTLAVGGEATTLDDPQPMDDDTASTTSLSPSSNSDEEEVSSCTSSEELSDHGRPSPQHGEGPLDSLSALCKALPVKRGLSRYFAGKSQSFTCLADVRSVADLAKPLNPFVKRRKTGNCVGKEACHRPRNLPASSISKRPMDSNRKGYHVAAVPRSVPRETIHTIATGYESNSIALKCFSSPELGEAAI